jgi:hypothetical protein
VRRHDREEAEAVPSRRSRPPAGQEAQIDFELRGTIIDGEGKPRRLWTLIVSLSFSRYTFVWPTFTQTVQDVCAGLDAAWRFFGGVRPHGPQGAGERIQEGLRRGAEALSASLARVDLHGPDSLSGAVDPSD